MVQAGHRQQLDVWGQAAEGGEEAGRAGRCPGAPGAPWSRRARRLEAPQLQGRWSSLCDLNDGMVRITGLMSWDLHNFWHTRVFADNKAGM